MALLEEYKLNEITQGTIVDNVPWRIQEQPLGIVLTNACDFEWDKASFILIASLMPAKDILQNSNEFNQIVDSVDGQKLSKGKTKSLDKYFSDFIYNRNIVRYFFIDPQEVFPGLPHLLVDFQHLTTLPFEKKESLQEVAQLPSPQREKLILHFSSYVSRIAVDRVDDPKYQDTMEQLSEPYELKW